MSILANKDVHHSIENWGILKLVVSPELRINGLGIPTAVSALQSFALKAQIHDIWHGNNLLVRAWNVFLDQAGIC